MTARSAAEIRADLADCDRDDVPWPSAARRLLADIEPLLGQLADARAERERVGRWIDHYKREQEAIIARYMTRLEALKAKVDQRLYDITIAIRDRRIGDACNGVGHLQREVAALSAAPHGAHEFDLVAEAAKCSTCGEPMDTPGCSKRPGDDRPRALAGFHTIAGPGPVCDTATEQSR